MTTGVRILVSSSAIHYLLRDEPLRLDVDGPPNRPANDETGQLQDGRRRDPEMVTPWLLRGIADAFECFTAGDVTPCEHSRAGEPVTATWMTLADRTASCTDRCRFPGEGPCDRCGRRADTVRFGLAWPWPGLLVAFRLCPACVLPAVGRMAAAS